VARVLSVNVGQPRQLSMRRGRPLMSAIVKAPVDGPVRVEGINVAGDRQADLRVHGGPDKAVYAYAREDMDWWERELGREIPDAMFGENLTVQGVDVTNAEIGERWRIGTVELEVCQPRLPCSKLGLRFQDLKMVKRFGEASRPGAYLRIVTEGTLRAGDEITVHPGPGHGITLATVSDALLLSEDDDLLAHVASAPRLAADLAAAMRRRAAA
jgi:MOSC domain-containing protein YiiM